MTYDVVRRADGVFIVRVRGLDGSEQDIGGFRSRQEAELELTRQRRREPA